MALRWEESAGPPVPRGDLIYDPGSIWKMYRAGEDYYAALTYQGEGQAAQAQGVLRANPTWDDLTLTEQRTGPRWQSLLNIGAGELILRTAILFTGGLVFHSSGLDDNGKGIVFVGHSGAGKSTQVGLWSQEPGVIAMNDDRIAVRVGSRRPDVLRHALGRHGRHRPQPCRAALRPHRAGASAGERHPTCWPRPPPLRC